MLLPADPRASYLVQRQLIDAAILEVLERGLYILGPKVRQFEQSFAGYIGSGQCVGVANGTDAVHLALRSCGVGPGDRVITVAHTAVATVSAIEWIGAKPVLVDIDPDTFTISTESVAELLERDHARTIKAVIAVHIYGHAANLNELIKLCKRHGAALIEDCAQAHGATFQGRKLGSIGTCGSFSFYPTKNLGAFGDGGAVTTSDPAIADRLRLLQQYGWRERYISEVPGYNSRLDEIQAAILNVKLGCLDAGNARRRQIAERYTQEFAGLPVRCPTESRESHHVFHQYVIRVAERDSLKQHLEVQGVKTAILYPVPIHLQPGYKSIVECPDGALPVTEQVAREILCLPIFPELSDDQVGTVIHAVQSYFVHRR